VFKVAEESIPELKSAAFEVLAQYWLPTGFPFAAQLTVKLDCPTSLYAGSVTPGMNAEGS
jgi:hypothetical protein